MEGDRTRSLDVDVVHGDWGNLTTTTGLHRSAYRLRSFDKAIGWLTKMICVRPQTFSSNLHEGLWPLLDDAHSFSEYAVDDAGVKASIWTFQRLRHLLLKLPHETG